ncbi:hypothetical protein [Streptomyces apocyni]|uniref:hypothetical protein n=1 Tax=Streptomyces apocyni TaxID=2654677 RepID=UPI0012E9AA21|nr:hypothetical protein [Streptomyces apocyni]
MTDPVAPQGHPHPHPPEVPESAGAVWLKGQLLGVATALYPDRRPVEVREWSDPVRLAAAPAPVGHRHLFLIGVGGDDRPSSPGFANALDAFTEADWTVRRRDHGLPGESWATVGREDFQVRVYEGVGPGILTFTGWTPVVFAERQLVQPRFTPSTIDIDGVVCQDCQGSGVCLLCEGRPYTGGSGGYGRCWCAGNNAGPGACVECAGRGYDPAHDVAWKRRQHGLSDPTGGNPFAAYGPFDTPDIPDAPTRIPTEAGHGSNTAAFIDVSQRHCACGEFRCFWRNVLSDEGDHRLSRFAAVCQGCAAHRAYAFRIPPCSRAGRAGRDSLS